MPFARARIEAVLPGTSKQNSQGSPIAHVLAELWNGHCHKCTIPH
jgi:hypothetical protein